MFWLHCVVSHTHTVIFSQYHVWIHTQPLSLSFRSPPSIFNIFNIVVATTEFFPNFCGRVCSFCLSSVLILSICHIHTAYPYLFILLPSHLYAVIFFFSCLSLMLQSCQESVSCSCASSMSFSVSWNMTTDLHYANVRSLTVRGALEEHAHTHRGVWCPTSSLVLLEEYFNVQHRCCSRSRVQHQCA